MVAPSAEAVGFPSDPGSVLVAIPKGEKRASGGKRGQVSGRQIPFVRSSSEPVLSRLFNTQGALVVAIGMNVYPDIPDIPYLRCARVGKGRSTVLNVLVSPDLAKEGYAFRKI